MVDFIGNTSFLSDYKAPEEPVHSPNREIPGNELKVDDKAEPNSPTALVLSAKEVVSARKARQDI